MKKQILVFGLFMTTVCMFSQKNYLQTQLTNSVIANFFDTSKDKISLVKGEYDDNKNCYIDAEIENYSSKLKAKVTIESNSQGYIDIIVISHDIGSINEYNNLVNNYLVYNLGTTQTIKTKNINKKFNLISNSKRNDTFTINGSIEGSINSYGHYEGHGHLTVIFVSFYSR